MIEWIQDLVDKDRESFLTFCKRTSSPIQMYLYARFLGYTGSIVVCDEWSKTEFKKKDFTKILETEIDFMQQEF